MQAAGFWSYSRGDNDHLENQLTELRQRIAGEVSMILGTDVSMFQDVYDLRTGDKWKDALRGAVSTATFLVPVLSPRYFARAWCREETLTFLAIAKEKGVQPLIFPLRFVDGQMPSEDDEVRAALADFQTKDFTQWRFSGQVERLRLENAFARDIVDRIVALAPRTAAAAPVAAAPQTKPDIPQSAPSSDTTLERTSPAVSQFPTIIVDRMTGRGNYDSIQTAIDAAPAGARILVRPGRYRENLTIAKPIELIGDGSRDDIVVFSSSGDTVTCTSPVARIAGISFSREAGEGPNFAMWIGAGNAEVENCLITSKSSAGLAIGGNDCFPTIRLCKIFDCNDAGIFVAKAARPVIEDCEFASNKLSGAVVRDEETYPSFRRCVSRDNLQAGFYFHSDSSGVVDDCDATANGFSGIALGTGADPLIAKSRMRSNQEHGAFIYETAKGRFERCEITANIRSGLLVQEDANPVVADCTITSNAHNAIRVLGTGGGEFIGNDLRKNKLGPWHVEKAAEAKIVRTDNRG